MSNVYNMYDRSTQGNIKRRALLSSLRFLNNVFIITIYGEVETYKNP